MSVHTSLPDRATAAVQPASSESRGSFQGGTTMVVPRRGPRAGETSTSMRASPGVGRGDGAPQVPRSGGGGSGGSGP